MNEQQEKKLQHQSIGPGGPKCFCCGQPRKQKRRAVRRVKRALRNLLRRALRDHETP